MNTCPLCDQPIPRAAPARLALTPQQRELWGFIRHYIETNDGVAPSYDEMRDYLQLQSKSGVHRLIKGLEERGWLVRMPYQARAIQIIDPDSPVD